VGSLAHCSLAFDSAAVPWTIFILFLCCSPVHFGFGVSCLIIGRRRGRQRLGSSPCICALQECYMRHEHTVLENLFLITRRC